MKAVVVERFAPFEEAQYKDMAEPRPGPGEVLVDMRAADVNFPDLLVVEGNYQIKPPLPFAPGKGGAGVVAAVGAEVSDFAAGDRVSLLVEYGTFAEKLAAPAANCFRLPDGMPFDDAAALCLVYQTAYFALKDRAQHRPEDTVLVLGASGGVGVAAIQLAKAFGSTVIAATRGEAGLATVGKAGADHVVDTAMDGLHDGLRDAVGAVTGGRGADIVIDPVGGAAHGAALRAMAWRGRMVIIGFAAGEIPTIKANYLLLKNIAVAGLNWNFYRDHAVETTHAAQAEMFALYGEGRLRPLITQRFALADFAKALRLLRDGRAQGKIILEIGAGRGDT